MLFQESQVRLLPSNQSEVQCLGSAPNYHPPPGGNVVSVEELTVRLLCIPLQRNQGLPRAALIFLDCLSFVSAFPLFPN